MAFSLHQKESKTSEYEDTCQYEQLARNSKWVTSMECDTDRANKTKQSNMSEMIRREAQDPGRTNNENEESIVISEIPQIVVEGSFQLPEQQTFNHIDEDYSNPQQIFVDSADMSTLVAGASTCGSSTDSDLPRTGTIGLETSSILSVLNYEDNSCESPSSSSQIQLVIRSQTSIPLSSPAPHLQHYEPSTSSLNPSISFNDPSSIASDMYTPALDILAPASSEMDRPQAPDQVLSSQLWDSQVVNPSYDGMMSPSMFIPPPPYTAQPPGYDTIERTCSVSTISELQRSAPFTWEMPPSYDAARDADRLCLVQDLRHRSATTGDWNKKNFLCCISFAVVMFFALVALGFFVASVTQ